MAKDMEEAIYYSKPGVYKAKKVLKYVLIYALLILVGISTLLPFYIMLLTSVKSVQEMESTTFIWFKPIVEAFNQAVKNYTYAWNAVNYGRSVLNTVLVAMISTVGTITTTILSAYAFSRLSFKGRDILFALFLTTMMVPGEMFIITNYVTVGKLGWTGLHAGYGQALMALTIPFMTSIFYTYYLRQTFKTVPNELYYAAKVDGTTDFKYLIKVMIPIAAGTIISITILNAMSSWNAYIWPTLVTENKNYQLITAALRNADFSIKNMSGTSDGRLDYTTQMAAAVMVTLPLLVVFFALKKHIMRGVSRSGIKG